MFAGEVGVVARLKFVCDRSQDVPSAPEAVLGRRISANAHVKRGCKSQERM